MNEQDQIALIVKTVSEFDAAFPTRNSQVLLTGYATLINELAFQIKKNLGTEAAIQVLIEVVKETAKGSNCNVMVHKHVDPRDTKGHLDA